MKSFELSSNGMGFIPNFVKTDKIVQKSKWANTRVYGGS